MKQVNMCVTMNLIQASRFGVQKLAGKMFFKCCSVGSTTHAFSYRVNIPAVLSICTK